MIAITTKTSSRVKPRRAVVLVDLTMNTPLLSGEAAALRRVENPSGRIENPFYHGSLTVIPFAAQFRQIPNLDGIIAASRDQELAIGAEGHAADQAQVTAEGVAQLS